METKMAAATLSTTGGDAKIQSELTYFLLQNFSRSDELSVTLLYGVKAVLTNSGAVVDSAEIMDVTSSKEQCIALIRLLERNTVTPATLADVVYDLVSEGLDSLAQPEDFGCAAAIAETA